MGGRSKDDLTHLHNGDYRPAKYSSPTPVFSVSLFYGLHWNEFAIYYTFHMLKPVHLPRSVAYNGGDVTQIATEGLIPPSHSVAMQVVRKLNTSIKKIIDEPETK